MNKVEISIIIPCYNCSKTIEETLRSVECDSFRNYEIVIINDGSTDSTLDVIENYKKESAINIKILTQDNAGVSVARNKGIEVSSGKYLLFLDGDDLFAKGYIEAVSILMNQNEVDVMSCYRTTNREKLIELNELEDHYSIVDAEKLLKQYTFSKAKLGFTSFVYKKEILEEFFIRFEEGVKYGEDWEFATKYLAHCGKAIELNYYCYYYRILDDSVSRTTSFRQVDAIQAAERTAQYLVNENHPFAKDFMEYMYNRAIFSVAHRFAKGNRYDFLKTLIKDYPVKNAMVTISRRSIFDKKTRLAAIVFLISPRCFYFIAKR